jgi:alkylhydroperoxidase family enzyme
MNVSRAWAWSPELLKQLFALMGNAIAMHDISARRRAVIVAAAASAYRDSYCSLAWGARLAAKAGPDVAAAVLTGSDLGLTDDERALATWARKVARDPNATTATDVGKLRAAGFTDHQIFAITVFIGLRVAFSTVNDALGVRPDSQFRDEAPSQVRDAVNFGRSIVDP